MRQYIQLHPDDNVVVALCRFQKHDVIDTVFGPLRLLEDIPPYFKVAMRDITKEDRIIKYGMCIGTSTENIIRGQLVHTHNICSNYL